MTDTIDRAAEIEEQQRVDAIARAIRPRPPSRCERCGQPAMLLSNGARCRFCERCIKRPRVEQDEDES